MLRFRHTLLCLALPLAVLLSACGGGGGGSDGGGGNPPPTDPVAPPPVLSGIASVGAPLGGARIAVVDAQGTALGNTTAHPTDGTYRLTLSNASFTLPLLVQARGVDAAGRPALLHTVLTSVNTTANTTTNATTAHVTPLTQALSALVLGGDPQPVFAKPTDFSASLGATNSALNTAALEFLKTLIKTGLTDVKITNTTGFNPVTDPGFITPKSSADLLLEGLRIQLEDNRLSLSNKFLISLLPEVEVDLAKARTELLKPTDATPAPAPATAITSTLKVTTTASALLNNAGTMDGVVATLNPLLAAAASAASIKSTVLTGAYDQHDGVGIDALADQLASWGAAGYQLGPVQVLACVDDAPRAADCTRVLAASTVSDRSGTPRARLVNVISYFTAPKKWQLSGNAKALGFEVRAASWLRLNGSGEPESGGTNPSGGIEVLLQGRDATGTDLITTATVQSPAAFALPFASCQSRLLCLAPPNAVTTTPTGGLADHFLQPGVLGWLGGADAQRGARYRASYTRGTTAEVRSAYLPTTVNLSPDRTRSPVLDGVSDTAPLTASRLRDGYRAAWAGWAALQPQWQLVRVRAVARFADRVLIAEADPAGANAVDVPGLKLAATDAPLAYDLWLMAVNNQGQMAYTRYTLAP